MAKDSVTKGEAWEGLTAPLPLFEQIASGFLKTLASGQETGEPLDLGYLDGDVKVDGASYGRRVVVIAIEDLKRQIEAPLRLRREAYTRMMLLKLNPVPELKLYRDIATAILRIDAALRLTQRSKTQHSTSRQPVYH